MNKKLYNGKIIGFVLIFITNTFTIFPNEKKEFFGRYVGVVSSTFCKNGVHIKLNNDFKYIDPFGQEWNVPNGSVVDGASIPIFLWSIIGSPLTGKYREASVIHDIACDLKIKPWKEVHRAFYFAMRASGVGELQAKIMYAGVYFFGPRWEENEISIMKDCVTESNPFKLSNAFDDESRMVKAANRSISENRTQNKDLGRDKFDEIEKIINSKPQITLEEIENLKLK